MKPWSERGPARQPSSPCMEVSLARAEAWPPARAKAETAAERHARLILPSLDSPNPEAQPMLGHGELQEQQKRMGRVRDSCRSLLWMDTPASPTFRSVVPALQELLLPCGEQSCRPCCYRIAHGLHFPSANTPAGSYSALADLPRPDRPQHPTAVHRTAFPHTSARVPIKTIYF